MENNRPKISFVMAGRNDDYGGNFLNRMRTSIRTLLFLAEKYDTNFELVIVDYNPPADKLLLKEALALDSNSNLNIRHIIIPHEFHLEVSQGGKNPFPEYIAKNIGIRRANGTFIASVNPDIIFSDVFVKYLASGNLDANYFYRANRHDLDIKAIDDLLTVPEILQICRKTTVRIWTNNGSPYVSWKRWFKRFKRKPKPYNLWHAPVFNFIPAIKSYLNPDRIHDAAAGDFIIMHRDAWFKTRGFDQIPFLSYVDGYHLFRISCFGLKQEIIPFPIYHVDHRTSNGTRPSLDIQNYLADTKKMQDTGIPYKEYSPDWGFPKNNFAEKLF